MTMTSSKPILRKLLFIALLLTLLAIILWFTRHLLSTVAESSYLSSQTLTCDFNQNPCHIKNPQGSITLKVTNKIIQSFEPLDFTLQFTGDSPKKADIDFQGVEMFMGVNQLKLTKQSDGFFTGTQTLPGHSDRSMTWRALINFAMADKQQQVIFEFKLD